MGNHIKEVDATLGNKPDRKAYGYLCLVPQHNQVMNLQNDFNKLDSKIQEVFENWDNKILPHLPQQMDEMAKRTGALHRKRGVCSCVDLLRMLFLYASSNFPSVSLRLPPVPLESPLFLTPPGGSVFPKLRFSCVKYSIPCF